MKTILKLMLIALFLPYQCAKDEKRTTLNGKIAVSDSTKILFTRQTKDNRTERIDSVYTKNGHFEYYTLSPEPEINLLIVDKLGSVPFIRESGKIEAQLYKDSLFASIIKGTQSNNDLMDYKSNTKKYVQTLKEVVFEAQKAKNAQDTTLFNDLNEQFLLLRNKIKDYDLDFIASHKDSYVSLLLLQQLILGGQISTEKLRAIFETLGDDIRQNSVGQNITKILSETTTNNEKKLKIGHLAPTFSGPKPNGDVVHLADNLGKITLIDFWASWCRPCRIEAPRLVRINNKYASKGLKIVSISLDKDKESWLKAIDDDGLDWLHISNLKFWKEPIAQKYQVNAVPTYFLLNSEGRIIDIGLSSYAIDRKLNTLFAE